MTSALRLRMRIGRIASIAALALAACSTREDGTNALAGEPSAEPAQAAMPSSPAAVKPAEATPSAAERMTAIATEVAAWRRAPDLATAKRHAEAARNLIVGPNGPNYGDSDGDGTVAGASRVGLLPGLAGGPALAIPAANACVTRDLLGGSWDDAARRWQILQAKIDTWRPGNNTFPTLPSHAQRIVGWATLTLASSDLATAHDFAGHAQIHVDVSRRALIECTGA